MSSSLLILLLCYNINMPIKEEISKSLESVHEEIEQYKSDLEAARKEVESLTSLAKS